MAKFTKLSFCQKLFFWHKTSSCNCSMCPGKISDSFSKSSGISWFLRVCTIWALTKHLLRSKVLKKCSMCLHCVCKVSDGLSKSSGTSWFLRASTSWAVTKPLLKSSVKMAKFKRCHFVIKYFYGIKLFANVQCVYIVYTKYEDVSVKAAEWVEFPVYALPMHH